jgi:hypothetical protein
MPVLTWQQRYEELAEFVKKEDMELWRMFLAQKVRRLFYGGSDENNSHGKGN